MMKKSIKKGVKQTETRLFWKCYLLNKLTNEKTIYNTITEARKHTNLKPRSKENESYKIIDIL